MVNPSKNNVSVRDSITNAMKEIGDELEDEEKEGGLGDKEDSDEGDSSDNDDVAIEEDEPKEEKKAKKQANGEDKDGEKNKKDVEGDTSQKDQKEGKDLASKKGEVSNSLKPPPGWTKEGKTSWSSLSPDIQKSVLKREKEFSDGIAAYANKSKAYDEFDRVIAPYREQIKAIGATEYETVGRLFQWMDALARPQTKLEAFKALGAAYGIDINQMVSGSQQNEPVQDEHNSDKPPNWFNEFAGTVGQKLTSIEKRYENEQQSAAERSINQWAADKEHFSEVRELMYGLIQSGRFPPKNGMIDLDGAYNAAIYAHPEVRQQILEKERMEATSLSESDAANRANAARLAAIKARKAGVGIRPTAPSTNILSNSNKSSKSASVRDSIMEAIEESRAD